MKKEKEQLIDMTNVAMQGQLTDLVSVGFPENPVFPVPENTNPSVRMIELKIRSTAPLICNRWSYKTARVPGGCVQWV